jgi:hypothetical protein
MHQHRASTASSQCGYYGSAASFLPLQEIGLLPEHPVPLLTVLLTSPRQLLYRQQLAQLTLIRLMTLAFSAPLTRSILLSRILSAKATCWTAARAARQMNTGCYSLPPSKNTWEKLVTAQVVRKWLTGSSTAPLKERAACKGQLTRHDGWMH